MISSIGQEGEEKFPYNVFDYSEEISEISDFAEAHFRCVEEVSEYD
jgi:hypothetical protein